MTGECLEKVCGRVESEKNEEVKIVSQDKQDVIYPYNGKGQILYTHTRTLSEVRSKVKFIGTEGRMVARGRGNEEFVFNGYRVSVGKMTKFWRGMVVVVAQHCECT